jgi:two-component system LytT family response regulator
MIRVAVADDEPLARRGVIAHLRRRSGLDVVAEYADGTSAARGLRAGPADLIILDVQMPGLNGLDVLAGLTPEQRPLAIMLTAHDRFAVRAFELQAVDYLLKPLDAQRLDEALDRAVRLLNWRRTAEAAATPSASHLPASTWPARFAVRVGRRSLFVATEDIEWIEAEGDYASLHVAGRTHLLRESLHQLAASLDPTLFVRIHRSAIVRVDRVAELQALSNRDALLRLHDGTPLRVSRTYIDHLLARLHARSPTA